MNAINTMHIKYERDMRQVTPDDYSLGRCIISFLAQNDIDALKRIFYKKVKDRQLVNIKSRMHRELLYKLSHGEDIEDKALNRSMDTRRKTQEVLTKMLYIIYDIIPKGEHELDEFSKIIKYQINVYNDFRLLEKTSEYKSMIHVINILNHNNCYHLIVNIKNFLAKQKEYKITTDNIDNLLSKLSSEEIDVLKNALFKNIETESKVDDIEIESKVDNNEFIEKELQRAVDENLNKLGYKDVNEWLENHKD